MAESYSVKAVLSAVDRGFISTLKGAEKTTESLASKIKSGFAFGVLTGMGQQAFSALTSSVRGLMSEMNSANASWKTFEGNLSMIGKNSGEIKSIKKELQSFAEQTVYNASDMATTYSQLAAVGVKDTTKLVKGFGGLAAASENPKQAMKTLSTQATQMAAKPTVAWQDFKLMLEQTPAGIAAVAKQMGMTTSELVAGVQDGTVATEDFFDAISKVGTNKEFTKLATEYKTVGQAMDGLTETVSNKLAPAFDVLSGVGIKAVSGIADALDKIDGEAIAGKISGWIEKARPYWESFKQAMASTWSTVKYAFKSIKESLGDLFGEFGSTDSLDSFRASMDSLASFIKNTMRTIQQFFKKIADTGAFKALKQAISDVGSAFSHVFSSISKEGSRGTFNGIATAIGNVVKWISKAVSAVAKFVSSLDSGMFSGILKGVVGVKAGFKALNFVKSFKPFSFFKKNTENAIGQTGNTVSSGASKIVNIVRSIGNVIKSAFEGIGIAAQGIGTGIQSAFIGIGKALKLANPVNILAVGAAIGIIVAAFTLLATQGDGVSKILVGISGVLNTVGKVISTIITTAIKAVAQALLILSPIIPIIAAALVSLSPLVTAFGEAFSLVAQAIGEAVSKIIEVLTPIVEIIGNVVTEIVRVIGDVVVGILNVISPILPELTSCFTQIADIVSNAIVRIVEAIAPYIPCIQKMVEATAQAIQAVCDAFKTLVQQIVPIIQAIIDLVVALGDAISNVLHAIADVIESVGNAIKNIFEGIGNAISKVIDSIAGVIESIGNAALNAGKGFDLFANGIKTITELDLFDMVASMAAVASEVGGLKKAFSGFDVIGSAVKDFADGLTAVSMVGGTAAASIIMISRGATPLAAALVLMVSPLGVIVPAMNKFAVASTTAATGISSFSQSLFAAFSVAVAFGLLLTTLSGNVIVLKTSLVLLSSMVLTASKSIMICSTMISTMCSGMKILSGAILNASSSGTRLSGVLTSASKSVTVLSASLMALMGVSTALSAALLMLSSAVFSMLPAAASGAIGVAAFGTAMMSALGGTVAIAGALLLVGSSMADIADDAKMAEKSLTSMRQSMDIVDEGLSALGDMANNAMDALCGSLSAAEKDAKQSGKELANGFTNAVKNGLAKVPVIAMASVQGIIRMLKSGYSGAYSAGAYISQGFAQGMLSAVGTVQNAAAQLAAAADAAIRAKAKIGSPSKVADDNGVYYGEGLENGLLSKVRDVWRAAEKLVSLPSVQTPDLSMSYGGEMNMDYDYYQNARYTVEVPLYIDGKEFAKATADDMQNEIGKKSIRVGRKHGIV